MHLRSRSLCGWALAFALLCLAPLAHASDITYTYTGNPYSYLDGFTCTQPLCGIQGSLTLTAPLAANSSGGLVSPVSFNFTNGADTYTQANVILPTFAFWTDSGDNIIGWSIILQYPGSWTRSFSGPGFVYSLDTVQENYTYDPYIYYKPGTWTVSGDATSETPEPATWALLATGVLGLLGVAFVERRRRAGSCPAA